MNLQFGRFALATLVVVGLVGTALSLVFRGPGDRTAIWISGAVALAVQPAAFMLGRMVGGGAGATPPNLSARLGIGALVRFLTVVVYAVLIVTVLHLPPVAALISLAAFFFLSTLIEPVLIRS